MNIPRQLSTLTLAIAAALPFGLPLSATAQGQTYSTLPSTAISSFTVDQAPRLWPGSVLTFHLEGTPGAAVTLQIADAATSVAMSEVRPGSYEGKYTIRQQDRLSEASRVSAFIVKNGVVNTATLARSLEEGGRDPVALSTPQITGYQFDAPERVLPGEELHFSMTGTPGGTARVAIQGVNDRIPLTETSRGVYEGSYVIRRKDKIRGDLVADAYLVSDRRETRQRLEHQTTQQVQQLGRVPVKPTVVACTNCGAVQSVNVVEVRGESKDVLGTIAGGLLGGVLGHQVGGGSGKNLATVIGAVGGAYAGNRIENNMDTQKVFRVTVRLDGGSSQTFDYAADPSVSVGTRVKVENGALIRI